VCPAERAGTSCRLTELIGWGRNPRIHGLETVSGLSDGRGSRAARGRP
jgi:hypothetical protein